MVPDVFHLPLQIHSSPFSTLWASSRLILREETAWQLPRLSGFLLGSSSGRPQQEQGPGREKSGTCSWVPSERLLWVGCLPLQRPQILSGASLCPAALPGYPNSFLLSLQLQVCLHCCLNPVHLTILRWFP